MTYHISVGMLNPIHLLAGQKLDCKTEIISREQYVLNSHVICLWSCTTGQMHSISEQHEWSKSIIGSNENMGEQIRTVTMVTMAMTLFQDRKKHLKLYSYEMRCA